MILLLALGNMVLFLGLIIDRVLKTVKRKRAFLFRLVALDSNVKTQPSLSDQLRLILPQFFHRSFNSTISTVQQRQAAQDTRPLKEQLSGRNGLLLGVAVLFSSAVISYLTEFPFLLILLGFVLGGGGALYISEKKQQSIRDRLEAQLPEILETMARVYRVQSDLRFALAEVVEHQRDQDIKSIFSEMLSLSRFGYRVEEAMEIVATDVQSRDLRFVVSSIALNIPVGGNLAALFDRTAVLLRQRKEAKEEIAGVMFQSKFSAIASACLVPIIIIVSFSTNPDYQEVLLHDPTGRLVFFACLLWWLIGLAIIRGNTRVTL